MSDKKDSKLMNLGIIIMFIVFGIVALMSIMMLFLTLGIENAAKQYVPATEDMSEDYIYNGRSYYMLSDDTENVTLAQVDFPDLGVERLNFAHAGREIEKEFGITRTGRYLSMIDDIENPTKEYTLHFDIWSSKYKFFLDRKEKEILESYDGDIVTPELDYGGQSAYWLGEQLVIRCDDKNLLILHRDTTTPGLLETEICADFMRNELEMPKRLNALELIFYSDEK